MRGRLLTASPPHNTRYSKDKIDSEGRFSGNKEHIKETKIADSVETAHVGVQIRGVIVVVVLLFYVHG